MGERLEGEALQAEEVEVVRLVGILKAILELDEQVAVQEASERADDPQGVSPRESRVAVAGHRVAIQAMPEAPHREPLDAVPVSDLQCGLEHESPGQPWSGHAPCRSVHTRSTHDLSPPLRRRRQGATTDNLTRITRHRRPTDLTLLILSRLLKPVRAIFFAGGRARTSTQQTFLQQCPSRGCGRAMIGDHMIVLGIVLLIVGYLVPIPLATTIGFVLIVVGLILFVLGSMGRAVGGRRHYW